LRPALGSRKVGGSLSLPLARVSPTGWPGWHHTTTIQCDYWAEALRSAMARTRFGSPWSAGRGFREAGQHSQGPKPVRCDGLRLCGLDGRHHVERAPFELSAERLHLPQVASASRKQLHAVLRVGRFLVVPLDPGVNPAYCERAIEPAFQGGGDENDQSRNCAISASERSSSVISVTIWRGEFIRPGGVQFFSLLVDTGPVLHGREVVSIPDVVGSHDP